MMDSKLKKYLINAAVVLLLAAHVVIGIDAIKHNSLTFDESMHLTAGYSYLKTGKYYIDIYCNPPFARLFSAIPLFFMDLELMEDYEFEN